MTPTPKLCECGCGEPAPIATKTTSRLDHVKGQPVRFIHGHGARKPVKSLCSVKDCGKPLASRELCGTHLARERKGLPLDTPVKSRTPQQGRTCTECDQPASKRGWCNVHYNANLRREQAAAQGRTLRPHVPQTAECVVEGCNKPPRTQNLCPVHFMRMKRHGSTEDLRSKYASGEADHPNRKYPRDALCSIKGCGNPRRVNDLCITHNGRLRTHGDVRADVPVRRYGAGGSFINGDGYRVIYRNSTAMLEHRMVMEEIIGRPLTRRENVHHVNGVRHQNDPGNLELWVKPQPQGQRVADLVAWVAEQYPVEVAEVQDDTVRAAATAARATANAARARAAEAEARVVEAEAAVKEAQAAAFRLADLVNRLAERYPEAVAELTAESYGESAEQ